MKINQLDLRWIANKQLILEFENIFLRMDIIYLYQLLPALLQRIFICNSGFLSVLGWRDSLSTYTVLLGVLTISSLICMHKHAFLVPLLFRSYPCWETCTTFSLSRTSLTYVLYRVPMNAPCKKTVWINEKNTYSSRQDLIPKLKHGCRTKNYVITYFNDLYEKLHCWKYH